MCSVTVANTVLQQVQGMHGSFSRADTMNFMLAAAPSFKRNVVSDPPVRNADLGRTVTKTLYLDNRDKGALAGRRPAFRVWKRLGDNTWPTTQNENPEQH